MITIYFKDGSSITTAPPVHIKYYNGVLCYIWDFDEDEPDEGFAIASSVERITTLD